jgi:hypothetical protein
MTGLLARGRADDPNIVLNAGNVSLWPDKTGNGNSMVQATAAKQPLFVASSALNGQPAVRMTSSGTKYVLGTMASRYTGSTITVIMIGSPTYASGGRIISCYTIGVSDDFTNTTSFMAFCGAATVQAADRNGGSIGSQTIPTMASGLPGVFSARMDGAHCTLRLSGTDASAVATSGALGIDHFSFGVGWQSSAIADFCAQLDLCEWLIYDHALSSSEWTAVSAYTTPRFGVAA